MPRFRYSGFDAGGRKVSGSIDGSSRRTVQEELRGQGLFPAELIEEDDRSGGRTFFGLGGRVGVAELAAAARQLGTLLGAGLPLDEALDTVAGQIEQPRLARAMAAVREGVIQGDALHAALGKHAQIFPPLFVNMVQVGENSGTLDQALHRLADFLEEQARLQSRIMAAITYPALMAVVGTGILFFLIAFVVPKITRMLEELDQALPLPTLFLIKLSDLLQGYWWLLLGLLVIGLLLLRRYLRTTQGRLRWDGWLLKAPLFGRLNLLIATSRLARTLATLLHSGMPLLKALDIATNLVTNRVLRGTLEATAAAVREGEGLAVPLKRSGAFPPMLAQMAAVGEKSGDLESMLLRVAETYEHQVDMRIAGLLALLEPLMILLMGSLVGFIVMAILLPIFQASSGMG